MPAEFNYFPFDTGEGSFLNENRWRLIFTWMRTTGVLTTEDTLPVDSDLVVIGPGGPSLTVDIETGEAIVQGMFWSHTDDPYSLSINSNSSGDPRIDLVVLRTDFVNNIMFYFAIEGTPAMSPVAPSPVQNESVWDLPLAQIDVADSATQIDPGDVTDVRVRSVQGNTGSDPVIPACRLTDSAPSALTNSNTATLTFDTEIYDTTGIHDTSSNSERVTISVAGLYQMEFNLQFAAGMTPTGPVICRIYRNDGMSNIAIAETSVYTTTTENYNLALSTTSSLLTDDYLYVEWENSSGETVTPAAASEYSPIFAVTYLGSV